VEPRRVQAGDLQAGARHADQPWHVLGGDLATHVAHFEAEQVAVERDRAIQVLTVKPT